MVLMFPGISDCWKIQGQTADQADCFRFLCYTVVMSRIACIVVPSFAHHITQRGNRRMDVFERSDDHLAYLRFLKQYVEKYGLSIYAYCLMTNHVHRVAVPGDAMAMGKCCGIPIPFMPYTSTRVPRSRDMCGRGVSIPVRLTNSICGQRHVMWSVMLWQREWWIQ